MRVDPRLPTEPEVEVPEIIPDVIVTTSVVVEEDSSSIGLIIGVICAAIVIVALIVVVSIVIIRKRRNKDTSGVGDVKLDVSRKSNFSASPRGSSRKNSGII